MEVLLCQCLPFPMEELQNGASWLHCAHFESDWSSIQSPPAPFFKIRFKAAHLIQRMGNWSGGGEASVLTLPSGHPRMGVDGAKLLAPLFTPPP